MHPDNAPRHSRSRRLRGSNRAAVGFAVGLGSFFFLATLGGILLPSFERSTWWEKCIAAVGLALPVALFMRSLFMGVYVSATSVVVRSWFWTYTIERSDITAVLERGYVGTFTRGSGSPGIFNSWFRAVGFQRSSGRRKMYDGVILRHPTSKRIVSELTSELQVPLVRLTTFD